MLFEIHDANSKLQLLHSNNKDQREYDLRERCSHVVSTLKQYSNVILVTQGFVALSHYQTETNLHITRNSSHTETSPTIKRENYTHETYFTNTISAKQLPMPQNLPLDIRYKQVFLWAFLFSNIRKHVKTYCLSESYIGLGKMI